MGSTYFSLHYHLIFGTKNVEPVILPAWRNRLHAYLGGCVREIKGIPVAIGGVADHVHLLIGLRPSHTLSDFMRDVKSVSSRWVHNEVGVPSFQWQEGYGAFCVSASKLKVVRLYIENQEEHHRKKTFREEYIEFLEESGVEFDDRYLL
jgi:putative transposase